MELILDSGEETSDFVVGVKMRLHFLIHDCDIGRVYDI